MWMTFIFAATTTVFLAVTFVILWHLRWVRRLPPMDKIAFSEGSTISSGRPVRCSVVIAARNEEARIEQTLRHLLAQRAVGLEIIVVDDRSSDRTGEILQRMALEDSRIRVKRVDVLPDSWLGKCHACHIGAAAATGDWILFTDADCWLTPDMIPRAVRVAECESVDHVTVASGLSASNAGLRASHLAFLMSTANWFSGANRDFPKSHLGFGAFNLVRAEVYRRCGGYEALRLTVLDDVKLGLLVRRAGKRTRAFIGGNDVECHWGRTTFGIIQIMEKNYFAALDYRTSLVLGVSALVWVLSASVMLGLLSRTLAGLAAALSPLSLIVPGAVIAFRLGWSWHGALLIPFMLPVFYLALLNSAIVTLRQGGIRWRDTFYPLQTLRAGNIR